MLQSYNSHHAESCSFATAEGTLVEKHWWAIFIRRNYLAESDRNFAAETCAQIPVAALSGPKFQLWPSPAPNSSCGPLRPQIRVVALSGPKFQLWPSPAPNSSCGPLRPQIPVVALSGPKFQLWPSPAPNSSCGPLRPQIPVVALSGPQIPVEVLSGPQIPVSALSAPKFQFRPSPPQNSSFGPRRPKIPVSALAAPKLQFRPSPPQNYSFGPRRPKITVSALAAPKFSKINSKTHYSPWRRRITERSYHWQNISLCFPGGHSTKTLPCEHGRSLLQTRKLQPSITYPTLLYREGKKKLQKRHKQKQCEQSLNRSRVRAFSESPFTPFTHLMTFQKKKFEKKSIN
ncbi:uncharacterized protein LOC130272922 [Hyla sarda]|uniref:uncharacterized protein LOC130272922 n=1 Tax=Hyla sarda TaxID=327740 RepID=UPI0024C41342|nr:uncharacterized protein LOC130272922 [Hyla sarda]